VISKLLMAFTMALTALGAPGTTADVFQAGDHYMMISSDGYLTLWEEANGRPGLQPDPVVVLGVVLVEPDRAVTL
jgi:hypothetical protein